MKYALAYSPWSHHFFNSYVVTNSDTLDVGPDGLSNIAEKCWDTDVDISGTGNAPSSKEAKYPDGWYKVTVTAGDIEGDTTSVEEWVIVDNFIPVVDSTDPTAGEGDVDPFSDIKVFFSEQMDETTIVLGNITVMNLKTQTLVPGTISYDPPTFTLIFDPDSALEPGAEHDVAISDRITDVAGNKLDGDANGVTGGDHHFRFTVGVFEDTLWLYEDEEQYWGGSMRVGTAGALRFQNNLQDSVRVKAITYSFDWEWHAHGLPVLGHVWEVEANGAPHWEDPPVPDSGVAHRDFLLEGFPLRMDWTYPLDDPSDWFPSGETFFVGYELLHGGNETVYSGWNWNEEHNGHSWWYNSEPPGTWYPLCQQPGGTVPGVFTMEVLVQVRSGGKGGSAGDLVVLRPTTTTRNQMVLEKASAVKSSQWKKARKEPEPYFSGAFVLARRARSVMLGDEGRVNPELPATKFQLFQNSPNPFSAITCIRYSLPSDVHVHLAVYDITGRLVTTLVDERQGTGDHMAIWNGHSESPPPDGELYQVSGSDYPAGIYLYRLRAGNRTATKKLILLR